MTGSAQPSPPRLLQSRAMCISPKAPGSVAVDRAAVLDGKHARAHARELVVGNIDQRGERDAEGQAEPRQDLARALDVDEGVVGDDGASRRRPGAPPAPRGTDRAARGRCCRRRSGRQPAAARRCAPWGSAAGWRRSGRSGVRRRAATCRRGRVPTSRRGRARPAAACPR